MASTPNVNATGGADFTSKTGGPLTDSIKEDHEEVSKTRHFNPEMGFYRSLMGTSIS